MSDNKQNPQQGRRLPVRKTATGNQHPVRQNKQSDNPESLYAQTVGKNGPILSKITFCMNHWKRSFTRKLWNGLYM